jgi:DnaJ family protein C protein 7
MSTSSDSTGANPTDDDVEMRDGDGAIGHEDMNGNDSPIPPPHKVASPPRKPAFDPEACKATGNKYFKAKDYAKAIAEYTKGERLHVCAILFSVK